VAVPLKDLSNLGLNRFYREPNQTDTHRDDTSNSHREKVSIFDEQPLEDEEQKPPVATEFYPHPRDTEEAEESKSCYVDDDEEE
jgi:hypothetical protein